MIWIVIAAITFAAGIVHSVIGFGFGIVALACLPFIMDAKAAHVMMSMCSLPMLLSAAWAYRDGIDWRSLRPAMIGAAFMMPVGLYCFVSMPLDLLVRGTGLAILLMTLNGLRKKPSVESEAETESEHLSLASFAAGAISGLLGGAVSIAGPPIASFALNQGWRPDRFKAFLTQCLLVVCFYKVAGLGYSNLITQTTLVHALWGTPFAIAGIRVGVALSEHIDAKKFQVIVSIALIGVSCWFMFRGQP